MIPIFKTSYSFGKSILTVKSPKYVEENGPDSIISIAKENGLDHVFIVDDTMGSYEEAKRSCKENELKLTFGLRFDCGDEDPKSQSKFVLLAKSNDSEEKLIQISSKIFTSDYKKPRISFDELKTFLLENKDLFVLCVPYYDVFIHNNRLKNQQLYYDFSGLNPVFFLEDNDLLFDDILRKRVVDYCETSGYQTIETKSIYYKNRSDFTAFLTNKCIQNRSTIEKPEFPDMTSDSFCWEDFLEKDENK